MTKNNHDVANYRQFVIWGGLDDNINWSTDFIDNNYISSFFTYTNYY